MKKRREENFRVGKFVFFCFYWFWVCVCRFYIYVLVYGIIKRVSNGFDEEITLFNSS